MTNSPYNDPEYLALLADWFEHQNTKGRWDENECPVCGQDLSGVEMPEPGGMFVCRICGTSMVIMD